MNETNTDLIARKLAYIATIESLNPIPGADRIEVAQILNWQCVVKKGEYSVGSKVIFIEVDSRLPAIPQFEFMRERKFKVKAIKLKKQVSQGLVVPLKDFPEIQADECARLFSCLSEGRARLDRQSIGKLEPFLSGKSSRSPSYSFWSWNLLDGSEYAIYLDAMS